MFVSRVSMEDKPSGKMKGAWRRPAGSFWPVGWDPRSQLSLPDGGLWKACLSQPSLLPCVSAGHTHTHSVSQRQKAAVPQSVSV